MMSSKSLAARALIAVSLLVGFYVLALAIGLFLLSLPVLEVVFLHRLVAVKLVMLAFAGGFVILWSIFPRIDKFEAPGPRLAQASEPRLFSLISEVASKTGQDMPKDVYLVLEPNAWVAQRGGAMGVGSKRVMGLGLPLLQALSVDELRAVLAHEFGHYHGGDTKLGPWIYKTRSAIGRTLQNLGEKSALQAPFRAYGEMFLRTTQSISREQEYTADALAADAYGAKTMQGALRRVRDASISFPTYFQGDLMPLLQRGYRPPIAEGFSRFLVDPQVAQALSASFAEEMKAKLANPERALDSHPPMPERLRALDELTDTVPPGDTTPSISLLSDVGKAESDLLLWISDNKKAAAQLKGMAWSDAAAIYLDSYREIVNQNKPILTGLRVQEIPTVLARSANDLEPLRDIEGRSLPLSERHGFCLFLFGAALAISLVESGWTLNAAPGIFVFTDGERQVNPFQLLTGLARNELTAEGWSAACDRLCMPDGDLGMVVREKGGVN